MRDIHTFDDFGMTLEVEYEIIKGYKGLREQGSGVPLEPDVPDSVEITGIWILGYDREKKRWVKGKDAYDALPLPVVEEIYQKLEEEVL